jgi:ureidoacrylate peracid hydrolase
MTDTRDGALTMAHVEPLMTLADKVSPAHTALVIVDVQNDFCAERGMMHAEGNDLSAVQAMADRLPGVIDAARRAGAFVVFVRSVYSTDGNAYLSDAWLEQASRRRGDSYWKRRVCGPDSWEGDFYGDVRPRPGDPIVTKHRFSAFHNTDLDTILRSHGVRTLVMTGVATNVCVETTARDGFTRDYYIVFTEDGTATYSDDAHEATLRVIDQFVGEVVGIDDVVEAWNAAVAS